MANSADQTEQLSFIQRTRVLFGLENVKSPLAEVRRLMFSGKGPVVVTTDHEKFIMIMSAFTTYEKQVKPDSNHSDVSDVLKKLKTHLTETFPQDFPFYLILTYRLHLMYSAYDCDEFKTFVPMCISRFEGMDPKSIARVIINFIDRGDFEVMFPGKEAEFTAGVFFLLENACKELAIVSFQLQKRISEGQLHGKNTAGARSLYSGFVYSRMLWVSMVLKLHEKRSTTVTRSTTAIWQEHLLKYSSSVMLDMQTIVEFTRGLEFGRLLKLPTDFTFDYHRMAEFIIAEKRPLSHVKNFLRSIESYFMFDHDLADFLANIRASYDIWLREGGIAKLTYASVQGTLAGAISEGISFVDCVSDICSRRKVDHTLIEVESIKWLLLLLQLVDFADSRAETHLRQFLQNRGPVLKSKKCQQEIRKYIREATKANFSRLTIQQFVSLFKAFKIYPVKMAEEFLGFYEIRQGMKINDPTWQTFISEIVLRFGGARNHYFLLDFLKNVSQSYLHEIRQSEFVVDLLQLKVPKLFAMEEGSDEMAEKEDLEVARRFTIFLRNYIHRHALKQSLLAQMSTLLASISEERDDFQQLILCVLQKEVIPEFKVLQAVGTGTGAGGVQSSFQSVLEGAVNTLLRDLSWLKEHTTKQKFCWGLVAACCSKINIGHKNLDWVHSYDKVLKKVGHIFTVYCSGRRLTEGQCIIIEQLPEEVAKHPVEDIKKYFEWVREIQLVMKEWQDRFLHQRANYDEILLYASNYTHLHLLGHTLCITSLVCNAQDLHQIKSQFLHEFEALNIFLLKYIPEQPDAKWCTLPALLQEYGVSLPRKLREKIFRYVRFPGEPNRHNWDPPTHPVPPSTTGRFQPGHEISLELAKDVVLYQLAELITELNHFQQPLLAHLQMLVFFKLNKSVMFDKYLRVQIGHNTEKFQQQKTQSLAQSPQFSGFQFSVPLLTSVLPPTSSVAGREEEEEGLPMKIFIRSLEGMKELLSKVMNGNAKYSEIIAEGALDLENLDIDKEFEVLNNYSILNRLTCSGLSGVRSILELFQYSTHIHNIQAVCDQYKLKGCLADSKLTILKDLVGKLGSEEARAKLTPNEASEKLKKVKETLGVTERTNSKCLDLFAVIQDSVIFYQFIRDKQFYGENGNALFYQQYQLITAQLQHEEYDDKVLNYLFAAFKLMAPFMDSRQDLGTLMSKVLALDVTNGLRQLETVNANITLIRLWFSRAEGDTLENVANKELDSIIQTGFYIFTLSRDASGGLSTQIMLEYIPSTAATPQPQQAFTTSGHHSSDSSSDQPPFSFEAEGGGSSNNGPRTFPRLLSKMESQGGNELYGTGMTGRLTNFERWNTEQIGDFVRMLEFLDKDKNKGEGDKIKHFLYVNKVAYKLLELYIKLRELGHIQYINEGNTGPALSCQFTTEDVEERVRETEVILMTWTHEVANLREEFNWLLFFSVPKLLRLYRLLSEEQENMVVHLKRIVHEISFLCVNNADTRKRMNIKVQRAHEFCKSTMEENEVPVKIVGTFLNSLFEDHSLPHRCHPSSPFLRPRSITGSLSLIQEFTQLLHFCPGYTQDRLIRVIVGLYSGVPESFEVLHCRSNTTDGELNLFLKRAAKFPLQYLILEVNKLPYKLQEHLMQLRLLVQQEFQGRQRLLSLRRTPSTEESVDISSPMVTAPVIHFVETAPSVLREMPWIQLKEHKEPKLSFEDARKICVKTIVTTADFFCIQLVYGFAGDGKTHYIKSQLEQMDESIIIAVNEAFTPLKAISKFRSLPLEKKDCGIFFNFTMLPPGDMVDEKERERYHQLMDVIGWFFFDLFILGYVEDPNTGKSFRLPGGLKWAVYIEVPSREHDMSPGEALKQFCREVPVLGLIGTQHMIPRDKPYSVDEDVQLVCKYLKALSIGGTKGIDKLYREGGQLVKFSQDPDLTPEECQSLLQRYMSEHVRKTKITQRLFIRYMKRRCMFLDTLPGFNYNTGSGEYIVDDQGQKRANDTRQLGSTLMKTMLNEVRDFCENWSHKQHQQLIYGFKDGGGSLGLISLHPEKLPDEDKRQFLRIGVEMPSMMKLYDRGVLDGFLSRALNIETDKDKRITIIDDSNYVLTLDYTIKMLNIHKRYECGVPVIIEGETGVGKTALVEMLSKLWNQSLLLDWRRKRARIIEFFQRRLREIETKASGNYQACVQAVENITSGTGNIDKESLLFLCQLQDGSHGKLYSQLMKQLLPMRDDPVIALLTVMHGAPIKDLFDTAEVENNAEATAELLYGVLTAQLKSTFHKINVHAAMTPTDIQKYFKPVFEQANALKEAFERRAQNEQQAATSQAALLETKKRESFGKRPKASVTVFLDEVNTSSCVGLFKEIIVNKTFDGEPIPDNVFIVAACNPHRGNSLATHIDSKDKWMRGSYYVRRLHPTLRYLMWDYGSLDESQERDYINSKMKMLNRKTSDAEIASLTNLIVTSQKCMRQYAYEQLLGGGKKDVEVMKLAQISSRSCVSQRDIQRVFTLYQWLMSIYERKQPHGAGRQDYNRRAVLVALGIVYYMRLNAKYRAKYQDVLNNQRGLPGEVNFTKAFEDELDWYIKQVELPKGIARTQALKENLFATIICTVTHTPLIIVGAPGSSKTLSFNQAIANLKGPESKKELFRDVAIFSSLDPHYYQCSRCTTSNEIQTVFSRAINHQRSHRKFKLPIHCVVFIDAADLSEESHESLKVLHYHLDKQEVSFVAITNHVLDAAKTNRAVSLFRPEAGDEDLKMLAMGCLCSNPENPPPELKLELEKVVKFCPPYSELMRDKDKKFAKFFGLRDFIHFVNYLRRKKDSGQGLNSQIVMQALERNFNGCEPEEFEKICKRFFKAIDASPEQVQKRGILEIVRDSLQDRPQDQQDITENEVRYKLIIDPSEDDSLVRLLFAFGVLKRDNTRMYVCSDFPGDGQVQKINTIAAIRHSAIEGHTVVMSQTDDIHESFYDLFNQRFRRIDDPKQGPRYYTSIVIGAHLKPSRVHPNFQCVVVVKKSEIKHTPAPFLNRFEKYLITYSSLLETAFNHMPPCMAIVVKAAIEKAKDFIKCVSGSSSLYGLKSDTLESLVLTLLPPLGHKYITLGEPSVVDSTVDVRVYLVQELLQSLRHCAGFHIPPVNARESELDADQLFEIVLKDPVFEGLIEQLDHNLAARAVVEAINTLHTATRPEDQKQFDLSPEGCMVISLLQQWFVRYFCKKLMQLMTSEALILNRNKIPFSYLVNYLVYQNHFSLKDLIERYYCTLEVTGWDIAGSPNKILCFTRSSPLIHQLPAQYPSSIFDVQAKPEDIQKALKDLVFEKTDQLVVCKLSSVISQTAIHELLKNFIHSDKTNVFVIVANMQKTSQQIVNHLRILIEETEALAPQEQKLFIFLLHFPPAQFFKPCYPSLFLKGWDHYYLDTIAHSAVKGVIDIRDWFGQCCFPPHVDTEQQDEGGDSLVKALNDIIPQAVPILSSRVYFGTWEGGSFNVPMTGTNRSKALREFLFDHGVGAVLCERFRSYWKPNVMAEYLDRAASFSKNRESTLNITDSIQTMFKALFFDFLVYMISRINDRFNIDILFDRDGSPAIQMLFLDILRVFPLPSLSQVKVLSTNLQEPRQISHVPSFPFFTFVSSSMEKLVEKSQEEANIKIDILEENSKKEEQGSISQFGSIQSNNVQYDRNSIMLNLQEAVLNRIREQMNEPTPTATVLAIEAISKHPELWPRYFSDFILHKMKLETDSGEGIAQKILEAFFVQLHEQEAIQKLVILHTYIHVYQLDLAKMAGIFRPLNKIQKLHRESKSLPRALSPLPSSPSHQFLAAVKDNPGILGTPEHLATLIIETLFIALVGSTYQVDSTRDKLKVWFKAYRDVMTLPTLKKHVYQALEPSPGSDQTSHHLVLIEAKLNVLHTTYLALLSGTQLDEDLFLKGTQVFQTLFSRHFEENQELKSDCPRLCSVTNVAVEVLTSTLFTPSLHRNDQGVRRLLEGLFAHFFSADRLAYHPEDVRWFLELANEQVEWRANVYEDVVSGDLSDDILTKFEKSAMRKLPFPDSTEVVPHGAISLHMFKLYLARILGTCPKDYSDEVTKSGPLELYQHKPRTALGSVLTSTPGLGSPGPYIPVFYQEFPPIKPGPSSDNALMQQPLAHLYFLTVLEHLMTQQWLLSGFVRLAYSISEICSSPEVCDRDKVLLWIELQAVVQVIAQNVPHYLDPSKQDNIVQFNPLREDINRLLNDDAMGGGKSGGHAMVIALHLYKLLKSSRKFMELMTKNFETTIKGVDCLIPFNDQLKAPKEPTPHLLPFMLPGVSSEQATLYRKVSKAMYGIHHNREDATALVNIAQECSQSSRHSHGRGAHHTTTSFSHAIDKCLSFRMMVWLVSYYEFYDRHIISTILCNIIGGLEMAVFLKEEGYIRLIQCFLNPALMLNRPESPNPLTGDQQVLELLPGGGHPPMRRHGQAMEDPLYKLFVPDKDVKQDQSDVDLRHSIANMVAMVMGCPSYSNHLFYHMFAADKLVNTYMTGFMYDAKINPEGLLYDCGVEFSPDGKYGRQDYMKHASRGTYTLHSLYLLLWANFGAFCIALLTQPDSDDKIHGNLISDWISVRHYCVSQLRTLWMHMRNNLNLSEEERTFFVMRAMKKFYELILNPQEATLSPKGMKLGSIIPHSLRGFFKTREELDQYEKTWHIYIYQPTWNELKSKFADYSQHWQSDLFLHLRRLELHYPQFPLEEDFTHRLLGTGDLRQHSEGGELMLLSRFSMVWQILQAGGLLLPKLVEFYQWLHTQLAHIVTYEKATTLPIRRVVELATKRYDKVTGDHLLNLYDFLKTKYNKYVELIGGAIGAGACAAVKRGDKVYTIADDVPLLHFLTDVEEEEQGNDWLFTVIDNIISTHNSIIETVYSFVSTKQVNALGRLLPDEPAKMYPSEIDENNCLMGEFSSLHGVNEFLQLIRSRYRPPLEDAAAASASSQQDPKQQIILSISETALHREAQLTRQPAFQLTQLEEDIVTSYIAGKPLIHKPSLLRTIFKFRQSQKKTADATPQDVGHSALDLVDMTERLPEWYKTEMEDMLLRRFEYEFHSANYHTLVEAITGLRTVVGYLIKEVINQEHPPPQLETLTVPQFMLNLYEDIKQPQAVLNEIGITNLTPGQMDCLLQLPLTSTVGCMLLFAGWVAEGFYDFCNLPFPLKTHLSEGDRRAVEEEVRERWTGSVGDLLRDVKQLIDVLKQSEADITKKVNESSQKSIITYLIDYHMLDAEDQLAKCIPKTILLQHYVSFRQALRRLRLRIQLELEGQDAGAKHAFHGRWPEFVCDLWQERLPHLRQEVYGDGMFMFDPTTGRYGFQEGADLVYKTEDELMMDLMNEPEHQREGGVGETEGGGGEGEKADSIGGLCDIDDSFEELEESEAMEPTATISHSLDLDQALGDEEEKERGETSASFLNKEDQFVQLLHFCPGYTQDSLIRVIVGLYSGVPESFHCRSNTTEGELNLFLKRAVKFPLQYLILEVNKLPYKLQEYLCLLVQQEFQGRQRLLSLRRTPSTDKSVDISSPMVTAPVIHFVETAPSMLREMPWIQLKEHKEPKLSFEDAQKICLKTIVNSADFSCIQLVYGFAGVGKTHYIKSQLEQIDKSIIIGINKAFTPLKAISKLRSLPLEKDCGIFFNFTMLPPGDMVDEKEREHYHQLMDVIGWFFFDLFILGYVEDPNTGKSFRLPGGLKWAVYIEVPSREHDMSPGEALKQFCREVPVLGLIGTQHMIPRDKPYSFDKDMQLVCKYLRVLSTGGTKEIDKLYGEGGLLAKFSQEPDLAEDECQTLLQNYMYMSEHVQKTNKDNQYLQEKLAQYELQFKQFTEEKAKAQERLDYLEIENKVLVKNKKIASEAKESLQQENCTLRQEMQILQQKLSLLQSENDQYRLSQQESIAFGLQPWKISRERIKIGKLIGGGGWGAVLEGDLKVAVKQFYPGIISSQNLARIRREMEMLARIRHPNLLQFIGVVFEDDENADVYANPPYILTELLDMSLREAYEKGQVSEENLYPIFQDTARALDYLHRRHEPIVHRDVSSANVLLKRLPNGMWMAKVSDLGSANLAKDSFTKNEGAIIYCAPEAFTDKSNTRSKTLLTPKIDVYSYGIMLCEVVNRTLPDQDKFQLLLEQSKDKQPELHSQIIIKCVNEEPKERPSMKDVLSALDKLSSPKLHATSK